MSLRLRRRPHLAADAGASGHHGDGGAGSTRDGAQRVQASRDGNVKKGERGSSEVETAYKVYVCPRGNLLFMRLYLMTDLKLL